MHLLALCGAVVALMLGLRSQSHGCDCRQLEDAAPGTALLVTAHPDDESMYFVPTVVALRERGWHVHLLCLSNGVYRVAPCAMQRGRV